MIINLEGPYASLYRKGYLRTGKDGRRRVDLYNSNKDRSTVSYARYVLSVKYDRLLLYSEEADHIDTDKTNDNADNLQILAYDAHKIKTREENLGRAYMTFICPVCNNQFSRETRQVKKNVTNPKCSRVCNGKANVHYTRQYPL